MIHEFIVTEHRKVSELSLIMAMQVAQAVKQPHYIPLYEAMTLQQMAGYFGLTEKRVRNAYKQRVYFSEESDIVSGKDLADISAEKKDLGRSYGMLLTFVNGLKVNVAFSANILLNARGLLHMAIDLQNESETAKKIADIIHRMAYGRFCWSELPQKITPWYRLEIEEQYECPLCDKASHGVSITVSQGCDGSMKVAVI